MEPLKQRKMLFLVYHGESFVFYPTGGKILNEI
jgi:hypothetical protein